MRSNIYDSLHLVLGNLTATATQKSNIIQKADESKKLDLLALTDSLDSAGKKSDLLCKLIYSMFSALRNDYLTSNVNTAFYTANLKPIKEFLDSNPKITNPSLNREEILKEANTYL
jgi:hypothetical protein